MDEFEWLTEAPTPEELDDDGLAWTTDVNGGVAQTLGVAIRDEWESFYTAWGYIPMPEPYAVSTEEVAPSDEVV